MEILDPKDRPVQIRLSDTGAWGSVTIHGIELLVRGIEFGVAGASEATLSLKISVRHCNIVFDHMKVYGEDFENHDTDLRQE